MTSWLVLQLADSAFPTGGFAHSAGLEAHVQAGELASLDAYCREHVDQLARGSLPLVAAVHTEPSRLAEVDALASAILWSQVAARASRAQGRALLDVAARSFGHAALVDARARLLQSHAAQQPLAGHLAPVFGFVTRTLGVERDDALATFLHLGVRGLLSAAVRLGVAGPTEAQQLHHRLHPALDAALARGRDLSLADVAQPSPLVELIGSTHDRLYSRLFQS
ncbi:MAG: urease accessory protein UreF [Kofleriaceae bacterium]|nr:urease accessory protein UreF [Kofleriaceae bacterium]